MLATPLRRGAQPDDSPELRRDRARNDRRLKGTFERIFEKYNKDFTDIGDEIDLVTGRLSIDNGHLASMQHERDTGSSASKRFVRAFTQELGGEDHLESRARRHMSQILRASQMPIDASEVDDSEDELQSSPSPSDDNDERHAASKECKTSEALVSLSEPKSDGSIIDPDAIQSLGTALAAQIASFLNTQISGQLLPAQAQQLASQLLPQPANPWTYPSLPAVARQHSALDNSPSPSKRSFSPLHDSSLWAGGMGRGHPYSRSNKRQRLLAGAQSDQPMPSIETDVDGFETDSDGSLEHETLEDNADGILGNDAAVMELTDEDARKLFYDDAMYNFRTLAHGLANRGAMVSGEISVASRRVAARAGARVTASGQVRDPTKSATWGLKRFTRLEDATILKLKKRFNLTWTQIAAYLPDRTEASLQVRWNRSLKEGAQRQKKGYVKHLEEDRILAAKLPEPSHDMLPDTYGAETGVNEMMDVYTAPYDPGLTLYAQMQPSYQPMTQTVPFTGSMAGVSTSHSSRFVAIAPAPPRGGPPVQGGVAAGSYNPHLPLAKPYMNGLQNHQSRIREPALCGRLVEERENWNRFQGQPLAPGQMFAHGALRHNPNMTRSLAADYSWYAARGQVSGALPVQDPDSERESQTPAPGGQFIFIDPSIPSMPKRGPGRPRKAPEERAKKKKRKAEPSSVSGAFIHVRPHADQEKDPYIKRPIAQARMKDPSRDCASTAHFDSENEITRDSVTPGVARFQGRRIVSLSATPETIAESTHPDARGRSTLETNLRLTPETTDSSVGSVGPHILTPKNGFMLDPALIDMDKSYSEKLDGHQRRALITPPREVADEEPEPQYPSPPVRNPLTVDRGRSSGSNAASLRSSVLRKSFATPHRQRASPAGSARSRASLRSGPVPAEDASDDDL